MAIVQELSERDFTSRTNACEALLEKVPADAFVFFSDEAHFHLSGYVNKQNMRYWADSNPRHLHQSPLHSPKVTVWCAISSARIVGPWFFEENGVTVTVNSERYVSMLEQYFFSRNWRIEPRRHLVSTGRSNGTHFKGVDVCFEGAISGAPDFNPRRFGVANPPVHPICPLAIFFVGIFKSTCLRQPPTKPRWLKGQHPTRNCQYTRWYASASHRKHQKPVHEVYRQWGRSPAWYDFQNCVK